MALEKSVKPFASARPEAQEPSTLSIEAAGLRKVQAMTNELKKGKLKRWNDDKGFGFIAAADGKRDVFIHISALKRVGRRPRIGDVIVYQIHTDNFGKIRAVNARIEGVANGASKPARRHVRKQNKSSWLSTMLPVSLVILVGVVAFKGIYDYNEIQVKPAASASSYGAKRKHSQNYSCAGKVYCSEMTSCDEAKFYLRNCPGTKMDGDRDGIPCERQWCSW
jgi:cold shock CspA family protein